MTTTSYGSRPTKRARRTRDDMIDIKASIYDLLAAEHPMTVRQVFYRLVSEGVVTKSEAEYKGTVCRLLTQMRLEHSSDASHTTIPFGWIADNTRWMRKPVTYSSVEGALRSTAQLYRRRLWDTQDAYVEVWLEKDALAGVLYEVTEEWDVPLMVTRGYPSLSFVAEAAEAISEIKKPVFIYYFGDHDPSGLDIPRHIEQRLSELAPGAEIRFERPAVLPEQIQRWNLPTRPTKRTDTRSKSFAGESVEVDAIPPRQLRELVRECITQHVDHRQLSIVQVAEESEREILEYISELVW